MSEDGISPTVDREIGRRFADAHVGEARRLLQSISFPLVSKADATLRARIQLAAIKSSRGTIDGLERALETARSDWRDLLVVTGLASDNWREVLVRDGFETP